MDDDYVIILEKGKHAKFIFIMGEVDSAKFVNAAKGKGVKRPKSKIETVYIHMGRRLTSASGISAKVDSYAIWRV